MATRQDDSEQEGAGTSRTRFTVRVSKRLADYLEAAVKLGIYGSSRAEVARKFMENELARLVREGLIKITPPEVK
jgi:Arc/MetJ-type ribon-helix-helix transcriptional regulator